MGQLLPVDVVVDTWNLRNQACDVLGNNRYPSIAGIDDGLRLMGFSVQHVYAAVACDPYSDRPSSRVTQALASSESFVQHIENDARGTVLRGRLTDRSGELEEKLVDVLCAVQVSRSAIKIATKVSQSRGIVVISEDIDLTPAYDMARELGVPVFAAANETVHTRPGDWMILGDEVMERFCGRPPQGDVASQRKRTLARQLLSCKTARRWQFLYADSRGATLVFRHRTGVEGHLPRAEANARYAPRQMVDLFPVDLHVTSSRSFPVARLSTTEPASDRCQHLVDGEVVEWVESTRVRVRRSDGAVRAYEAAPGSLLPGMTVALHVPPGSRPRLVGAIEKPRALSGWSKATEPKLATVEQDAERRGAAVRATIAGQAAAVALLPPGSSQPKVGDRLAVVPREADEGGKVTKVLAVSTGLPSVC